MPGEMGILRAEAGGARLARAPLEGGTPRDVMEGVSAADWSGDGRTLAVVRASGARTRLEFPAGHTVYETSGTLISPRVAPDGRHVALVDQSMLGNTLGSVVVVDANGAARRLSDGWLTIGGLAWTRDGREVWFSAARAGTSRSLNAVSLAGRERLVSRGPASLILQDIAPDGRALLTHAHERSEALGRLAGETTERDHSFYDWTHATDLLPGGRGLVFTAEGEGGGPLYTSYLWRRPQEPPVRLGEGHTTELSPDGTAVLSMVRSAPPRLVVLPTGAGEVRTLAHGRTFAEHHWAWWLPDGRVLFLANEPGHAPQLFAQALDEAVAHPIAPEGVTAYRHKPISPDGRSVLALTPGPPQQFVLWPLAGGPARPLPALTPRDRPLQWSADGRALFVRAAGTGLPVRIERVDLASGRRTLQSELRPDDAAGIVSVGDVLVSADGQAYAYNAHRELSELFLVAGLR